MNAADVLTACREGGTRLVRFLYCDNGGLIRGKATSAARLPSALRDGVGLTRAMMAMNCLDELAPVEGMGPVGEVRLVPDPRSYLPLPYVPSSASLCCDMLTEEREPWDGCPRSCLKRMLERAKNRGLLLKIASELEFSLAERTEHGTFTPADETVCFSSIAMTMAAPFTDSLLSALEQQGLVVEQYYPEAAHGQHEVSIRHEDALAAADRQIALRETVRGVAWQHGLYASFAAKPWPDDVGNGGHIHFSLWDEADNNLFYDERAADSLSTTGRQFLAGVLSHLPALLAVTCPTVNSYRRLQPGCWSSAFACYGHDNREAALRIVSPYWSDRSGTINLELKAADCTCNPYLAFGCLLAAGLDGIDRSLDPGEPVEVAPASLSEGERARLGIQRLPASLVAAVRELEKDTLLQEAMGPLLATSFLAVRRSEAEAFRDKGVEFEVEKHFYRY